MFLFRDFFKSLLYVSLTYMKQSINIYSYPYSIIFLQIKRNTLNINRLKYYFFNLSKELKAVSYPVTAYEFEYDLPNHQPWEC